MENRLIFVTLIALFLANAIHADSTHPLEMPDTGVPCITQSDCTDPRLPANAHCQAGYCICFDESGAPKNCTAHKTQAKFAVRNPAVLQPCKNDHECNLPNEYCNTTRAQCACLDGFVMASETRTCLPVATTLGSTCEDDQQCQKTMGNTLCRNAQCVCSQGYHHSHNSTCTKSIGFGDHCTNDDECSHTLNAECDKQSSLCGCSKLSTLNSDGTRCLLIATKIDEECIEKAQCTKKFPATDCIDKKCQCIDNNHYDTSSGQCLPNLMLNDHCSNNSECHLMGEDEEAEICQNNTCVCNENYIKSYEKCVKAGVASIIPGIFLTVFSAILVFTRS